LSWTFKAIPGKDGKPETLVGAGRDITEQRRLEDNLRWANLVLQNTRDGVIITDAETRIISVNQAFTRISGYEAVDIIGRKPSILNSGRQEPGFYQEMWTTIRATGKWQGRLWNRRKNGEVSLQRVSIAEVQHRDGSPYQYVGIYSAPQEDETSTAELDQSMHLDPLTELPNRLLFLNRLEHALRQAAHAEKQIGLLYLDIDQFKDVNDSLGYEAGDQLLVELAKRMKAVLRDVDTLSRLSGDEFTVLLENIGSSDELAHAAFQLKDCFTSPFLLHGQEVYTSASI
jgi:diguanylate cyclase (GGDEF)-like protein/PAS domain S-box-containing protein